jgi:hypothetical protein
MKALALAPLALAMTLLSTTALAANANVTGPLGDAQLVRGKKLGMSYLHYGASGADPNAVVTVDYGFHGAPTQSVQMSSTGYGNRVVFLDVPADAAGFWYTLRVSDGSVQSNDGQPFALPVRSRALSVAKTAPGASTVMVKYAGPVTTTYDTFLHLGWNDWNDVGDAYMNRTEFSYGKVGVHYDYNYVELSPPWWANYLDFVVKDARNGGTWDNNGGADWHQSIRPLVSASVNDQGTGTTYVTLTYSDGSVSPAILHHGTDGWQNVTDAAMQASPGLGYQIYLAVPSSESTLDFVFTDGNGHWDHNFGLGWTLGLR